MIHSLLIHTNSWSVDFFLDFFLDFFFLVNLKNRGAHFKTLGVSD